MRNVFLLGCLFLFQNSWGQAPKSDYDVVIYGATPSGIFAAINSARYGHAVALVEEYRHVGGLMTGGLSFSDFISLEALSGTFDDYRLRALYYYENKYGKHSKQVADCYFGVNAEPHVTELIFNQMLAEHSGITVLTQHRILKTDVKKLNDKSLKIRSVSFLDLVNNKERTFLGKVFIDATYEGDLAAFSGARFRLGRESRSEYCERFAGHIFTKGGQILSGGTGEGDNKIQAYNFRLIMTDSAANRRMVQKPDNYDRQSYLAISQVLNTGKVKQIFTENTDGILRLQPIANRKADINDIKNAPVRVSSLGKNYQYPNGTPEVRARIIQQHHDHILGMIYFLQNDESIPISVRREAQVWGLAKDEFVDNDNFPYRLYIREARRVTGDITFTEQHTYQASRSIRSVLQPASIAICDYALNCHGVSAPGPVYSDLTEGDFNFIPQPFQIPYGVMIPNNFTNLFVPVAISASHVGFSGIRLEPTWSALGQSAGLAAHLSIQNNIAAGKINVQDLQSLLISNKGKIIYVSDVAADSPFFEAVQFYGTQGFFHDLYNLDEVNLVPLPAIKIQYKKAALYHDIEPEKTLDRTLGEEWVNKLPLKQQAKAKQLLSSNSLTRGEFLKAIYQQR